MLFVACRHVLTRIWAQCWACSARAARTKRCVQNSWHVAIRHLFGGARGWSNRSITRSVPRRTCATGLPNSSGGFVPPAPLSSLPGFRPLLPLPDTRSSLCLHAPALATRSSLFAAACPRSLLALSPSAGDSDVMRTRRSRGGLEEDEADEAGPLQND